ncbi:MAG: 30S ribosome-binding factor RbfA [Maioricimonas sp. JB045]|uniref:30S ribosome-binding factor RbfA n=1 Tax=Maioricimonas sp. JC845 TaxID=3232138 RepID=UPI003459833D
MGTRRTAKVAEAIRQVVSTAVLFELRDPRVSDITILSVEVPTDLRTAKIRVSVMGDERDQKLCMQGLNSARGFLQSRIADRLDLRYTPVLTFVLDDGIKKSIEASRILREIAEQRQPDAPNAGDVEVEQESAPDGPADPESPSDSNPDSSVQ